MTPPHRSHRRPTPSHPLPGRPLVLEQLEDRTVPSTSTLQTVLGNLSYDPSQVSRSSILVGFHDSAKDYTNWSATAGTTVASKFDLLPGYYLVTLAPDISVEDALTAYAASSQVAEVTPDFLLDNAATPNDPRFAEQWALNSASGVDIDAPQAWDVTRGSTRNLISVMDTGIDYNHQDLFSNIWINPGEIPASRRANLVDTDGDGLITFYDLNNTRNQGAGKITDQNGDGRISAEDILAPMRKDSAGRDTGLGGWADGVSNDGDRYVDDLVGWNFVNDTNRPMDDNSHGTHVAGIIGATGNNGTGVSGVAWVTQMMAVKFMNSTGKGSIGSFIAGLDYAVAKGAKISNNSWAGGTFTSLLHTAIVNASKRGHIFVAASGNAGTNIDSTPSYPASYDVNNVVVVGSSSRSDTLSGFSNYGSGTVDVTAPGEGILSTLPGNRYGVMSGTSMAAPHVSAALSLIWAKNPSWTYTQVINRLLSTVDKKTALATKVSTGGRINVGSAVGAATTAPISTSVAPKVVTAIASGVETNTLNKITVTFSEPINPTTMKASAIKLLAPGGSAISLSSVTAVSGTSNKKWDLKFLTQNTPGTYSLQLGNAIKDLDGTSLNNYYTTFTIAKTATYSSTQTLAVNDNKTTVSSIKVNQNARVQNITVKVDIAHTYNRDLAIYLIAPNGQKVTLAYRVGGSGDGFNNVVFTDAASRTLSTAAMTFTGSYKPAQALTNLRNVPTLGTWKLQVQDLATGDQGMLKSWSMTITTTNGQTLSTSGIGGSASVQGFVEDPSESVDFLAPPASLVTTVSGPRVIGTQVVSPLTSSTPLVDPRSISFGPRTETNYAWLAREISQLERRSEPELTPITPPRFDELETDWESSDLVFQELDSIPLHDPAPVAEPPPTTARTIEEVLMDLL